MHLSCTCVSLVGMFGSMFTGQCVPEYSCVQVYVCVCTCVYLSTGIGGDVEFQEQKEQKEQRTRCALFLKVLELMEQDGIRAPPGARVVKKQQGQAP